MYFFFFFKQKTAYEMRISDWSSDVCSSDLIARVGLAAELGDPAAQALPQCACDVVTVEREERDEVEHPDEEVEAGDQHEQHHRLLLDREIGRASCRERVCKYV